MQTNTTQIVYVDGYGETVVQWSHPEPPSQRWTNRATKRLARLKQKSLQKFVLTVKLEQSLMGDTFLRLRSQAMLQDCEFLKKYLNEIFQKKGLVVTEVTLDEGRVDYRRNCVIREATIRGV